MRADLALVERGLARSRNQASALIESKRALVDGREVRKSSQEISDDASLIVLPAIDYVSRAGHKLAAALDEFGLEVRDRTCLDVGASTGGFTDVLLRRGAKEVVAIDVGRDQMVSDLKENPRVRNFEGVNARELSSESFHELVGEQITVDLVVADLSFISLTLVMEQLVEVAPNADFIFLVKPQFEVGKDSLQASGVVNSHLLRADSIRRVIDCANSLGCGVRGLAKSALPGTHGNIEYLVWISPREPLNSGKWSDRIDSIAREASK